jgi:hypothetical protein
VRSRTSLLLRPSSLIYSALLFCSLFCSLIFSSHFSPVIKRKRNKGEGQRDERGTEKEQNHDSDPRMIFRVPIRWLILRFFNSVVSTARLEVI